jgi:type I restriction enzyme S subunit
MRVNVGSIGWAHSDDLVGIISPDYVVFSCTPKINPSLLYWFLTSEAGLRAINRQTAGSVRERLYFGSLARVAVPLPPIAEQRRIVDRISHLMSRLQCVCTLQAEVDQSIRRLLLSAYQAAIQGASWQPMSTVAPLVRRPVEIDPLNSYPELGIRSFGKGSFHKPALEGSSVGTKKLFRIEEGDLVFNIVFAWEGAVAVATKDDNGRFGSHRFLTCVVDRQLALPEFLWFHFLTDGGLERLGVASPGGAGRNRTLAIDKLARISVPIPNMEAQKRFIGLLRSVHGRNELRASIAVEVAALLPSVLNRAFSGGF